MLASAIGCNQKAVKTSQEYYLEIAGLYEKQGKYELAEREYKFAILQNPTDAVYYNKLGLVYKTQYVYSKAEEMFKEAVNLDPTVADYHYNLGYIYNSWKDYEKAEPLFKEAIRLNPNHSSAITKLKILQEIKLTQNKNEDPFKERMNQDKNIYFPDRFVSLAAGIVYDKKTDLDWYVGTDKYFTWRQAQQWVSELKASDSTWRLPTLSELKSLYIHGLGDRNMTPLLETTGWGVWSSEIKESIIAGEEHYFHWFFNFHGGYEKWVNGGKSINGRVFAVRFHR